MKNKQIEILLAASQTVKRTDVCRRKALIRLLSKCQPTDFRLTVALYYLRLGSVPHSLFNGD